MILKGSQRAGARNLATHLMRLDDNDHVRLHELRGFASDNLLGAFREAEAISKGTRCSQFLFSLSFSPPEGERVPVEVFERAIERTEEKLGLKGQPRAIVEHEKEGRHHMHCVWSRIDAETMTARPLPFFKNRLMEISRELYLEHGWKLPRGLENAAERNPTNFTLAEWQQAKRQNIDPRWLKQTVQECWRGADNGRAFANSLDERGLFIARGDRRGFVVLDHAGDVWSLSRLLDVKTKDVRARLGDGAELNDVAAIRKVIGGRMSPAMRRHVSEAREQFLERSSALGKQKEEMTRRHRAARLEQEVKHQQDWEERTRGRAARLPRGLRGLWHRITGQYAETRQQNEREAARDRQRHADERQQLADSQLEKRALLQREFRDLRKQQARQLLELRRDIGRYLKFSRGLAASADREHAMGTGQSTGLRLERR